MNHFALVRVPELFGDDVKGFCFKTGLTRCIGVAHLRCLGVFFLSVTAEANVMTCELREERSCSHGLITVAFAPLMHATHFASYSVGYVVAVACV